jgi:4-hydroxy-tetrahydrodipicolinate reductase
MAEISVLVSGACGRMGTTVVAAVQQDPELKLVGAVDLPERAGQVVHGVTVQGDLESALEEARPQVMVDFTQPGAVLQNVRLAVAHGVAPVVGTTGFSEADLEACRALSDQHQVPIFIAPNFSLGAVLLMKFAAEAAKYFDFAEIIELHHENKIDAPSGTALLTARRMREARGEPFARPPVQEDLRLAGVRGGDWENIRIHSVRLPGLVAHQEVLLGSLGQTLSLRHDTTGREAFIPGVLWAVKKVWSQRGLVVGLEHLLE